MEKLAIELHIHLKKIELVHTMAAADTACLLIAVSLSIISSSWICSSI